jgi:hypothetical protein
MTMGQLQSKKIAYLCYKDMSVSPTRAVTTGEYDMPLIQIPEAPEKETYGILNGIYYNHPYQVTFNMRKYYTTITGASSFNAKIISYKWDFFDIIGDDKCEIVLTPLIRGRTFTQGVKKYPIPSYDEFTDLTLSLVPMYTYLLSVEFKDPNEYYKLTTSADKNYTKTQMILITKWKIT